MSLAKREGPSLAPRHTWESREGQRHAEVERVLVETHEKKELEGTLVRGPLAKASDEGGEGRSTLET